MTTLPQRFRFGACELDVVRRELRVDGRLTRLQPRTFDLLVLLVQRAGQAIGKEALIREIWPTVHVTDAVLTTAIARVRRAIGDSGAAIATLHGVGYRFDAAVELPAAEAGAVPRSGAGAAGPQPPAAGTALTARAAAVPAEAPEADFASAQWWRVQTLTQAGNAVHALALLEGIEADLQRSPAVRRLNIQLLRQRLRLSEAQALVDAGLAQADPAASPLEHAALLLEQARLDEVRVDLPRVMQACEQALMLLAAEPDDEGLCTELLALQARTHYLRGEYGKVLELVQQLRHLAQLPRDAAALAQGGQHRCRALLRQGQLQAALQEAHENQALCAQYRLVSEQADNCLLLGFMAEMRWRPAEQVEMGRRAELLCSSHGDLTRRDRARATQLWGLIALGRLDEAQALLQVCVADPATQGSALSRWNLSAAQAQLDWRLGRFESAFEVLAEQARQYPDYASGHGQQQALLQAGWALGLGRPALAREVLERMDGWLSASSRGMLMAGLALLAGDRTAAKALLRRAWMASRGDETQAWDVAISLAWLLVEDEDLLSLDEVLAAAARLPADHSALQLLQQAHLLKRQPADAPIQAFVGAARRNCGIVHRHAWLLTAEGAGRWRGNDQKLGELFGTAWV